MIVQVRPKSGGSALLAKHGPTYFQGLAKIGWQKRKAAMKLYEAQQAKANLTNRQPTRKKK